MAFLSGFGHGCSEAGYIMRHRNKHRILKAIVLVGIALSITGLLLAQHTRSRILIVNGVNAGPAAVQFGGRSYGDIDTLAQITNGSVTYQPDRILLIIPGPSVGATSAQGPPGLSKDFASAAISAVAYMREWKDVVETVIGFGALMDGSWDQDYRDRAEASLRLASVAASTGSDQSAVQLLQNEFTNVDQWTNTIVATRRALNATRTMAPNAIHNDPTLVKISDCAKFLNAMLSSSAFGNHPSCH